MAIGSSSPKGKQTNVRHWWLASLGAAAVASRSACCRRVHPRRRGSRARAIHETLRKGRAAGTTAKGFAAFATGGSALLNLAAKQAFARDRPSLWESIAPEHNYSFPSGHAMGSMTLAVALVLLAWNTRWRWPVVAAMAVFVPMVGLSRVYLGVHYPSDILAGWPRQRPGRRGCT